jgi:hypothetical protein
LSVQKRRQKANPDWRDFYKCCYTIKKIIKIF